MLEENTTVSSEIPSDIHTIRTKEIVYSIRKLMQAGEHYTKELNKIYNVSAAQINCLLALHETAPFLPRRSLNMLWSIPALSPGSSTGWKKKDLVRRLRISQDRRVITVELTKSGKMLAENAPSPDSTKDY